MSNRMILSLSLVVVGLTMIVSFQSKLQEADEVIYGPAIAPASISKQDHSNAKKNVGISGIDAILASVDKAEVVSEPDFVLNLPNRTSSITWKQFNDIQIYAASFITVENRRCKIGDSVRTISEFTQLTIPISLFNSIIKHPIKQSLVQRGGGYGCGYDFGWLIINDSIAFSVPCGITPNTLDDVVVLFSYDNENLKDLRFDFSSAIDSIATSKLQFPDNPYVTTNDSSSCIE